VSPCCTNFDLRFYINNVPTLFLRFLPGTLPCYKVLPSDVDWEWSCSRRLPTGRWLGSKPVGFLSIPSSVMFSTWTVESKLRSEAKALGHGMRWNANSTNLNIVPFETDKWKNWNWKTIYWIKFQFGMSYKSLTKIIFETRKLGIFAPSCIKNHTNLSDNNAYNASFKAPGLLLLCPRIHLGKSSVVRADPGDSCV